MGRKDFGQAEGEAGTGTLTAAIANRSAVNVSRVLAARAADADRPADQP